jgi:hypothetical protein
VITSRSAAAVPGGKESLVDLITHGAGVSNAAVARLVASERTVARTPLSDADRKRIDELMEEHTDLADPDFAEEMLAEADDEDQAEIWLELLEDPTQRAYHWRVVLLLGHSKAGSTPEVDELLGSVEQTAEDEAATIKQLDASVLDEDAWAFPKTWSERVSSTLRPPAGLDVATTAATRSAATDKAVEAAGKIPDEVMARGLPVPFERALELRSFPFRFEFANLAGDSAIKAYAIAAKELAAAQADEALARGWAAGKQTLVADVAGGRKVIDATNWATFAAPRRYQPSLAALTDEALREDVPIVATLEAEDVDVGRYELALAKLASTVAPLQSFAARSRAWILFDEAMARADGQVAAASGDRRLDIANAWADALGYPAAARELMIEALKDNAGDMALDMAKDVGLSIIPVFGWIWRAKEAIEEIDDLISAGKDLVDARDSVEAAKTVVALQRAAARLSLQENATAATVGLTVAGHLPGGKKGKHADAHAKPGTHADPSAKPGTHPGAAHPDKTPGHADPDTTPGHKDPHADHDPHAADPHAAPKAGKVDVEPIRIQKALADGGTLKLLDSGRLVLCHSPCTFLEERYVRELDPARRARLLALAKREKDAIAAGDAVAEQAVFDDAVVLEGELRADHRLYLGTDRSATGGGRFRAHEATQGEHIEEHLGRPIEVLDAADPRHTDLLSKKSGDWWDPVGHNTWDGVGGQTTFDFTEISGSIAAHTRKRGLDVLFVDLSGFTEPERQQVIAYIKSAHKAHLESAARPFIKIYVDSTRGVL